MSILFKVLLGLQVLVACCCGQSWLDDCDLFNSSTAISLPSECFNPLYQVYSRRVSILKATAVSIVPNRFSRCNDNSLVRITEYQFGNSGNNLIEFVHGLYIAQLTNSTLIVPNWMAHIFHPFNTEYLHSLYCFSEKDISNTRAHTIEITSEESFFLFMLFKRNDLTFSMPKWDSDLIMSLSKLYVSVYSALWSSPKPHLINIAFLLFQELGANFRYTAIHIRNLDGGCANIYNEVISSKSLEGSGIPKKYFSREHSEHPLCTMPRQFVSDVMTQYGRNISIDRLFIAHDGRGDIKDYNQLKPILSNNIISPSHRDSAKFVDMLVAIHSDFFILNPRSTFSWQIFIIRAVLGLESVPILQWHDLYMKVYHAEDVKHSHLIDKHLSNAQWVSWNSILKSLQ